MVKKVEEIGERNDRPASDETKAKLIDTARREFEAKGFAATSMRSIRLQAGVSNGSAYHFFPDGKADLAALTYNAWAEELLRELSSGRRKSHASVAALLEKELLGPYFAWFLKLRGRAAFMLELQGARPNGDVRNAIAAAEIGLQSRLRDLLDAWNDLPRLKHVSAARLSKIVFGPAHQDLAEWARTGIGMSDPAEVWKTACKTFQIPGVNSVQ